MSSFVLTTFKSRIALTFVKLPPNDRNMHFNATYRNIVWCDVARVWPHCYDVLRDVGCCCLQFETGQIFHQSFLMLHDVVVGWVLRS